MKRILSILAAGALAVSAAMGAAVSVGTRALAGAPGQELTLDLSLSNDIPLTALQLTAELGAAAEVVEASAETLGRAAAHSVTAATDASGRLQLLLFSTDMATIAAGEGEVARVTLRLGREPLSLSAPLSVKATDVAGNAVGGATGQPLRLSVEAARTDFPAGPAYDFGVVPIRGRYTKSIMLSNTGTAPLTIDGVRFSSADYSMVTSLPLRVAPGSVDLLTIAYNPLRRGASSSTMTVESNSIDGSTTLRLLGQPYAVNELHVGSVEGVCDSEVTVPLMMNNMDAVSGFTLEFELPEELEYVDGSFTLDAARCADHACSVCLDGRRLLATAYSLTDTPFSGVDGVLASFALRLDGRGDVELRPSKAVLAAVVDEADGGTGEVENVLSAGHGGIVSISFPSISVADRVGFGRTPVTAPTAAMFEIYNYGNAPLTVERAVVDGDMDLSIDTTFPLTLEPYGGMAELRLGYAETIAGSYSGRLLLYSNDPDRRMVEVLVSGKRYHPNELTFAFEEKADGGTLLLGLDNYDDIRGMQFDLEAPAGWTIGQAAPTGRAAGWSVESRTQADGSARLFCFSLADTPIAAGSGTVLAIPYTHQGPDTPKGSYRFRISGIKLSDSAMADCCSEPGPHTALVEVTGMVTGVGAVEADRPAGDDAVYTLGGVRLPAGLRPAPGRPHVVGGRVVLK